MSFARPQTCLQREFKPELRFPGFQVLKPNLLYIYNIFKRMVKYLSCSQGN